MEKKLGMPTGTAAYIEKVQYYKGICAQVNYPWDEATALFEEALVRWSHLSMPAIVDKLAETVRQSHVDHPGKRLQFVGDLLLVKEDEK